MEDAPSKKLTPLSTDNNSWNTILDFVLPARPGCEVQAAQRIFEAVGKSLFRLDRQLTVKHALEGAVQKSQAYVGDFHKSPTIHFRVLVSGGVQAANLPDKGENAQEA